jgi:5'-nucleotidase
VRKLLAINTLAESRKPLVEVILLSQNSADTGLRIFNSIDHFKLDITRAAYSAARALATSSAFADKNKCAPKAGI